MELSREVHGTRVYYRENRSRTKYNKTKINTRRFIVASRDSYLMRLVLQLVANSKHVIVGQILVYQFFLSSFSTLAFIARFFFVVWTIPRPTHREPSISTGKCSGRYTF